MFLPYFNFKCMCIMCVRSRLCLGVYFCQLLFDMN